MQITSIMFQICILFSNLQIASYNCNLLDCNCIIVTCEKLCAWSCYNDLMRILNFCKLYIINIIVNFSGKNIF